jgi:hypothetical protein
MSKIIEVPYKNGWECIDWCRQETTKSNLQEDIEIWKLLVSTPDDYEYVSTSVDKNGKIVWKYKQEVGRYKNGKVKTIANEDAQKVINTIFSRICTNLFTLGFDEPEEITFSYIKHMANLYLKDPMELQLQFCRNATRQKVDEDVQAKYLEINVDPSFNTITNGTKVLYKGKIVTKQEANELNKEQLDSRSIDTVGNIGKYKVGVFQKVSKVAGSGQSHQTNETKNWLKEAMNIKDSSWIFVAQLDGPEAESHIPELKEVVKGYKNIFVGNSESCANYLNVLKTNK